MFSFELIENYRGLHLVCLNIFNTLLKLHTCCNCVGFSHYRQLLIIHIYVNNFVISQRRDRWSHRIEVAVVLFTSFCLLKAEKNCGGSKVAGSHR